MGATTDKVKGAANEAIGKAKQGVGEATGSDRLQGEGAVQEAKGKGQQALGDGQGRGQSRGGRSEQEALTRGLGDLRRKRPAIAAGLFFFCARHLRQWPSTSGLTTLVGSRRKGNDLVENVGELNLVFVARDIADMRGRDDIVHVQKRIGGVAQRLLLEHVDRSIAGTAGA